MLCESHDVTCQQHDERLVRMLRKAACCTLRGSAKLAGCLQRALLMLSVGDHNTAHTHKLADPPFCTIQTLLAAQPWKALAEIPEGKPTRHSAQADFPHVHNLHNNQCLPATLLVVRDKLLPAPPVLLLRAMDSRSAIAHSQHSSMLLACTLNSR